MTSALRLVFAGTPTFAATILQRLLDAGHPIQAVYTQPDRRAGRGRNLQASAVKLLSQDWDIPTEQPVSLKDLQVLDNLAEYQPDLLIVAAYGLILPAQVLALPTHGCINVHASLLPLWRGAAPVERAIEAGDVETGVTIMQMDEGLDTGPILLSRSLLIESGDTGVTLRARLAETGAEALLETLSLFHNGVPTRQSQRTEGVSYAHKLRREEARIDWREHAVQLANRIRAFVDANVCFCELGDLRIRVWQAVAETAQAQYRAGEIIAAGDEGLLVACGSDALRVEVLQFAGGRPMPVREVLRARRDQFQPGRCFSLAQPD